MSGMKNQTRSSKMMSLLFTATMQAATGTAGKIAAASMIGLAVILEIVAAKLDRRDDGDE